MIATMNRKDFLSKLNEDICYADWHCRYYTQQSRKYSCRDYWMKSLLGVSALTGAVLAGTDNFHLIGTVMAGGCAFVVANLLPIIGWQRLVSGLREEREEWTRILHGYESLKIIATILEKDEMLAWEYKKIEALKEAAARNDRELPEDKRLLAEIEADVRMYHGLDG